MNPMKCDDVKAQSLLFSPLLNSVFVQGENKDRAGEADGGGGSVCRQGHASALPMLKCQDVHVLVYFPLHPPVFFFSASRHCQFLLELRPSYNKTTEAHEHTRLRVHARTHTRVKLFVYSGLIIKVPNIRVLARYFSLSTHAELKEEQSGSVEHNTLNVTRGKVCALVAR